MAFHHSFNLQMVEVLAAFVMFQVSSSSSFCQGNNLIPSGSSETRGPGRRKHCHCRTACFPEAFRKLLSLSLAHGGRGRFQQEKGGWWSLWLHQIEPVAKKDTERQRDRDRDEERHIERKESEDHSATLSLPKSVPTSILAFRGGILSF